jgi:hypothetical protein
MPQAYPAPREGAIPAATPPVPRGPVPGPLFRRLPPSSTSPKTQLEYGLWGGHLHFASGSRPPNFSTLGNHLGNQFPNLGNQFPLFA